MFRPRRLSALLACALALAACQPQPAQVQPRPVPSGRQPSAQASATPASTPTPAPTPKPTPTPLNCTDFGPTAQLSLEGRLSNEQGTPISGARLELRVTDEGDFSAIDACPASDPGFVRVQSVESDSNGHYRFARVYPRIRQTLSVSHRDYQIHSETLSLEAGMPKTLDLSLKAYSANETFIKP